MTLHHVFPLAPHFDRSARPERRGDASTDEDLRSAELRRGVVRAHPANQRARALEAFVASGGVEAVTAHERTKAYYRRSALPFAEQL